MTMIGDMKIKKANNWTRHRLFALGIPAVLIPGILLSLSFGWNPQKLLRSMHYYDNATIFPTRGIVKEVRDGDTFMLQSGVEVRLLGINAPDRGEIGYASASSVLSSIVSEKTVYLEYDRYQDDKYGRILAWVWIGCEKEPIFLPANYMHLSANASKEGLMTNPDGCAQGILANEALLDNGNAQIIIYKDRGELKYEKRLLQK